MWQPAPGRSCVCWRRPSRNRSAGRHNPCEGAADPSDPRDHRCPVGLASACVARPQLLGCPWAGIAFRGLSAWSACPVVPWEEGRCDGSFGPSVRRRNSALLVALAPASACPDANRAEALVTRDPALAACKPSLGTGLGRPRSCLSSRWHAAVGGSMDKATTRSSATPGPPLIRSSRILSPDDATVGCHCHRVGPLIVPSSPVLGSAHATPARIHQGVGRRLRRRAFGRWPRPPPGRRGAHHSE